MLSVSRVEVRSSLYLWLNITILDTFLAIFKINELSRLMTESTILFSLTYFLPPSFT